MSPKFRCARFLARILPVCLFTACATGYQARGFFGAGFSEQRLAPEMWIVTFDASAFTPKDRVRTFLLRRCAEITVENGASYFAILGEGVPRRRTLIKPKLIDQPPFPIDQAAAEPTLASGRSARAAIQLYKEKPEEKTYDARELIRRLSRDERPQ
jgi:hypothetical protein